MDRLKPCPLCQSEDVSLVWKDVPVVECNRCHCTAHLDAWNPRTAPPDGGMVSREELVNILNDHIDATAHDEWGVLYSIATDIEDAADAILAACGRGGWPKEGDKVTVWNGATTNVVTWPPPPEESGL